MEEESERLNLGLRKDQLKDSLSCRFCALNGIENENGNEFIPIYERIFIDQDENDCEKSITLDIAINKYLPLKVN